MYERFFITTLMFFEIFYSDTHKLFIQWYKNLIIETVLGGLSSTIYTLTIIFVIGSFVAMQAFVKWENYQLKKSQIQTTPNSMLMSIKKLGTVSILVILLGFLHIYIIFLIPYHSKTVTFHLLKVFFGSKVMFFNSS